MENTLEIENEIHYNCIVIDTENVEHRVNSKQLYVKKLNAFKDWFCNVGIDRISIEKDLVYGGECRNDFLGTVDNWELLKEPTICKREFCTACSQDLLISKNIDKI